VATAVTDPRIYVAALEGMPGVLEVQASPDGGGMRVQVVLETAAAAASDGEAAST
jgi:hypothetical protein